MKKTKNKLVLKKKPSKGSLIPGLKREISHLLSSEEAKVSPGGVMACSIALMGIGLCSDSLAAHINQHQNWGAHGNGTPHFSVGAGHDSQNVHHDAYPHVSVAPHYSGAYPHTNSHTSVNEAVTKGTFHNNAADGYGKHTASLSHNNNPNTTTNTSGHYNDGVTPHFNYNAHSSAAPHVNVGLHTNFAPHHSATPHFSKHQNGHWNG